jgi:hypothetical protein
MPNDAIVTASSVMLNVPRCRSNIFGSGVGLLPAPANRWTVSDPPSKTSLVSTFAVPSMMRLRPEETR